MKYSEAKRLIKLLRSEGWGRTKEPGYSFTKTWKAGSYGHRRYLVFEVLAHAHYPLTFLQRENERAEKELERYGGTDDGFLPSCRFCGTPLYFGNTSAMSMSERTCHTCNNNNNS